MRSRSYSGLDQQVYEKTPTGNYDFALTFESPQPTSVGTASEPSGRPSIFTALEEQLGLKLERSDGPVETFVAGHVNRPSEN